MRKKYGVFVVYWLVSVIMGTAIGFFQAIIAFWPFHGFANNVAFYGSHGAVLGLMVGFFFGPIIVMILGAEQLTIKNYFKVIGFAALGGCLLATILSWISFLFTLALAFIGSLLIRLKKNEFNV